MRDLPPLRAVRAFEACYRLGSYTRAAAALNVQQPAISHQIRQLESDLGIKLFVKQGTAMVPTEHARELYRTVAAALGDIARASARLRRRTKDDGIVLGTYPGLASFWVLPRLAALRTRSPKTVVRITTAELDADIPLADLDCAILFGEGDWPGFDSTLLIPERVTPVAAPKLMSDLAGMSPTELLETGPLIHLEDPERRWFTWDDWRARFAPAAKQVDQAVTVTNHGIAIHQAIQGNGVTLGWTEMIGDLLESKVLMPAHDEPLVSSRGYYLLVSPDFQDTEACNLISSTLGVSRET